MTADTPAKSTKTTRARLIGREPKPKGDLVKAISAINKALEPFDNATSAMAVSAVAGVYAARNGSLVKRAAGLGANLETMVSAYHETIAYNRASHSRNDTR